MILTILFSFQIYLSLSSHHSDVIWHHVSVTPPSHHSSWVSSCVKRNQNSIQLFQNVFFNSFWKFWITWKSISDATSWIHQIQKNGGKWDWKLGFFEKLFTSNQYSAGQNLPQLSSLKKPQNITLCFFLNPIPRHTLNLCSYPKGQT